MTSTTWALSQVGALNDESARLFGKHGPTNGPPQSWMFRQAPTAAEWQAQLAAQTRLTITADEALQAVREAWTPAPDVERSRTLVCGPPEPHKMMINEYLWQDSNLQPSDPKSDASTSWATQAWCVRALGVEPS